MAVCANFVDGYLMQVGQSVDECTGYIVLTSTEYASFFEAFTISSTEITTSILFGFTVVLTAYFSAYPIGIAKRMISKL